MSNPVYFPSHFAGRTGQVDLTQVTLGASIDFFSVLVEPGIELPRLDGKPKFPKQFHRELLVVNDPSDPDVRALAKVQPQAPLMELEVAIDVHPRPRIVGLERVRVLEAVMVDLFASEVEPGRAARIQRSFRAAYRHLEKGYEVRPFNFKLPRPTDQQLHGGKNDPEQVKIYFKRTDQRKTLRMEEWVARIEVRLCDTGLSSRGLHTIEDLLGFKYRKQLMPFFTHVKGSRRRRKKGKLSPQMAEVIAERRDRDDRALFEKHGVGALLNDLKVPAKDIRLVRDIAVNDRLGQALMRLERRFRRE